MNTELLFRLISAARYDINKALCRHELYDHHIRLELYELHRKMNHIMESLDDIHDQSTSTDQYNGKSIDSPNDRPDNHLSV